MQHGLLTLTGQLSSLPANLSLTLNIHGVITGEIIHTYTDGMRKRTNATRLSNTHWPTIAPVLANLSPAFNIHELITGEIIHT